MIYREHIDEMRDRMLYYAEYLRRLEGLRMGRPSMRDRFYDANPHLKRPMKAYERLEKTASLLDRLRIFYPSREETRESAYTFRRDPQTGDYRYAH